MSKVTLQGQILKFLEKGLHGEGFNFSNVTSLHFCCQVRVHRTYSAILDLYIEF